MTIKTKLQSIGIDCDKEKDAIKIAKDALLKGGIKADRISVKIDSDGEKILEEAFKEKIESMSKKKSLKAPITKKSSDDDEISALDVINKERELKLENEAKKELEKEEKKEENHSETPNQEQSSSTVPFWKNSIKNKSINIKIKGKDDNKQNQTFRPLPKSTIEEFEKKKQEILDKNKNNAERKEQLKKEKQNQQVRNQQNQNQQGQNQQGQKQQNQNQQKKDKSKNINIRVSNNFNNNHNNSNHNNNNNNNNKNKNFNKDKQQFSKNQQKPNKPAMPNKSGTNKKITLNQSNASIAIGTNNRFKGKEKDKAKYNKDYENKKQKQVKPGKKDKHTITTNNYDNLDEQYRKKKKTGAGAFIKPVKVEVPEDDIKSITIAENISIKEFSTKLKLQPSVIIKKLFMQGKMVTVNDELTYEEAENIALEYDILCEREEKVDVIAELLREDEEKEENLVKRPPVVCVMGHVDHGKTSILDAIRKTNVIEKEAGGITQKIGAYQVKINDRLITFLDTPGHEAFTAMRLRGAQSTDIAVLVVAADDGVMPQTIEAINHAKAANVEVVVCINKIDKPDANPEKIKKALSEYDLIPEEWGGHTIFCETSAKQNIGIQNLLEMILLTADVLELKANPNRKARGIVIESELDKGKGPVARVLVQKGTLRNSDFVAMGSSFGKVRAMMDYKGTKVIEATPSMPVEILGLNSVPQAGDTFVCFDTEKEAKSFAETFISENKIKMVEASKHKVTLDQLFESIKAGEIKELPIVLKADVAGSTEAVKQSLEKLSNEEVNVKVIHEGVGNISESDVSLAAASNAIIIGFNIKIEPNAKSIISREKIDVRLYDIIYKAIEDVEKAMKGMFAPVFEEKVTGNLVIRQIFKASSVGLIAGCFVNDGEIRRNSKVRVKRGDKLLFDGELSSLKRFKDEVREVKSGFECGLVIDGFTDFQVDDTIEAYVLEEKKVD